MHIAVFCGSSMPRNKEIVEAAAALVAVSTRSTISCERSEQENKD